IKPLWVIHHVCHIIFCSFCIIMKEIFYPLLHFLLLIHRQLIIRFFIISIIYFCLFVVFLAVNIFKKYRLDNSNAFIIFYRNVQHIFFFCMFIILTTFNCIIYFILSYNMIFFLFHTIICFIFKFSFSFKLFHIWHVLIANKILP